MIIANDINEKIILSKKVLGTHTYLWVVVAEAAPHMRILVQFDMDTGREVRGVGPDAFQYSECGKQII